MGQSREILRPNDLQQAQDWIREKKMCIEEIDLQSVAFKKKYPPPDYESWLERASWRQFYLKQEIMTLELWIRERRKFLNTKELFFGDYESIIFDLLTIIQESDVALTKEQEVVVDSAKDLVGV